MISAFPTIYAEYSPAKDCSDVIGDSGRTFGGKGCGRRIFEREGVV